MGVVVRRWCCSTHTGNEVSSCAGGNVREGVLCILAAMWFLWDCVDFWWPVNTSLEMGVLEAQEDAIVGVVRLPSSSLASGPLKILNEHFQLHPCDIGN